MNRLFVKIFLSFWLTTVLILIAISWANWWAATNFLPEEELERGEQLALSVVRRMGSAIEAGISLEGRRHFGRRWVRVFDQDGRQQSGPPLPFPLRGLKDIDGGLESGAGHAAATFADPEGSRWRVVAIVHRPPALFSAGPRGALVRLALAMGISAMICYLLARYMTRPVKAMRLSAQRIAEGDLGARVAAAGRYRGDELGALARDLDRMAARLEASMAARDRLLRDLSHELRSPLARLRVAMELARENPDPKTFDRMEREYDRLNSLIDEVLEVQRLEAGDMALGLYAADLAEIARDVASDATFEGQAAGKRVVVGGDSEAPLQADAAVLSRALDNVIRNALRHSPEGGEVTVKIQVDEKRCRIVIADRGPGVPEAEIERLFTPFYQVADARGHQGFGIGLAIARAAIEAHGGHIAARNREGGGLEVVIELPR